MEKQDFVFFMEYNISKQLMKISFLIPPCFDHKQPAERTAGCTRVTYPFPNIYELSAAAVLEQNPNNQVKYHDFVYEQKNQEQLEEFFHNDDSDVYIIWSVNLSLDTDLKAIRILRKSHKNKTVVLLGPGPTHFIEKSLSDNNVVIVRGEPEATLPELIEALRNSTGLEGIKGISYIGPDGKVINNPPRPLIKDLDSLPFPARHLLGERKYHNPKLKVTPYATIVTSRNCPFKCIYCVPSSLTFAREIEHRKYNSNLKPPISFRSPANVEEEIRMLADQGIKAIGIMDDNFIWNEDRTRAICEIMKRYGMVWGCQARVDAITEPIAKMLSESGCSYVDLGIESFNDEILSYIKKGITVKDIHRAIGLLRKYKVPVKLNVLIGSSPLETRETVKHTLRESKRLKVDQVMFNIVSPFPGTEFYTLCKENGWLSTEDYQPTDVQRESILNLPNLTSREMERLLFHNNLSYFLSPTFVIKQLTRFRSLSEFGYALKALKIKLFG